MNLLEGGDQTSQLRAELEAKWKDKPIEELLRAKVEADLHIKTLESENAAVRKDYLAQREELLAKAKFEEYIDQIKNSKDSGTQPLVPEKDSHQFDPTEFKKLAAETYQEFETRKREVDNYNKVETKLKEKYGNDYVSVLKDQQSNLGLSTDEINNLAKKSPEAFFRLMGLNETSKDNLFQTPPRSGVRNDNFAPKGTPKRDWVYYETLRKTKPDEYFSPKTQAQMQDDAMALGDAFGI